MVKQHISAYQVVYANADGLEKPHHGKFYLFFIHLATLQSFLWNTLLASIGYIVRNLFGKKTSFKQVLWALGRSRYHHSSPLVDLFSSVNHTMKVDATRQPALDLCYHWEGVQNDLKKERKWIELWLARMFFGTMANRRALANRRIIVVRTLIDTFLTLKEQGTDVITMVSIASGSADAVIEAVRRARDEHDIIVNVILIDLDKEALRYAKKKAQNYNIGTQFQVRHGSARTTFLSIVNDEGVRPDIVEMVGFLDYRNDKYVIKLSSEIRKALKSGGYYLTCNIAPNVEKLFLDWVLLWLMPFYRTEKAFAQLILESGFPAQNIEVIRDPFFDIHTQIRCRG